MVREAGAVDLTADNFNDEAPGGQREQRGTAGLAEHLARGGEARIRRSTESRVVLVRLAGRLEVSIVDALRARTGAGISARPGSVKPPVDLGALLIGHSFSSMRRLLPVDHAAWQRFGVYYDW